MHIAELVAARHMPAAGVFAALTRRCPLRCRHCSTESGPGSPEGDAAAFRRFVATFTQPQRPEFLCFTGGEPLLHPDLVAELAGLARAAGTRIYVLTGAFFARRGAMTPGVRRAVATVDHVAISIDAYHEEQVPRAAVFAATRRLLAMGVNVSYQIVGLGEDDPYLGDVTAAVRAEFGDSVPMLVGFLRRYGRAASLPEPPASAAVHTASAAVHTASAAVPTAPAAVPTAPAALPCDIAAWPVIGPDGTITACGNQAVVDHRPLPHHLRLGHAATDSWADVRERCRAAPMLRALRLIGPAELTARATGHASSADYCATCWALPGRPDVGRHAARMAARPSMDVMEGQLAAMYRAQSARGFARRHGAPRYADLVLLGYAGAAS